MLLFIYNRGEPFTLHKTTMTGFILRIIAMSTMLLDHIGWNFIDNPMLLTWI